MVEKKKVLDEIEEVFDETKENIKKNLGKDEVARLTYGFVPAYRDLFPPKLDKKFRDLSPEAKMEVDEMFLEMEEDLYDEAGIMFQGDPADGTVILVGTEDAFEREKKKLEEVT